MTQDEFKALVVGRTIQAIEFRAKGPFGKAIEQDDLNISAIVLTDGTHIEFHASSQVEVDDVWVTVREHTHEAPSIIWRPLE